MRGGGGGGRRGGVVVARADLVDAVGPPDHDRLVVDHDERDVLHPERPPLPPPAARVRAARRREVAPARLVEDVERVLLLEGEEIVLDGLVARLWWWERRAVSGAGVLGHASSSVRVTCRASTHERWRRRLRARMHHAKQQVSIIKKR